jgi:two-component system phosphate regulon response regulator PhoB
MKQTGPVLIHPSSFILHPSEILLFGEPLMAAAAVSTTTSTAPATARLRVLVIEDERDLVDGLVYNLQREGYDTVVAYDGQEGLRKAQTLLPDLILLDIMLPGMSGTDILRELRAGERTRNIPVIIITARSEESDQMVGFTLGADDYVTKPFSPKVLMQRIKALQRRLEGSTDPVDVIEHLGVRIDRVRHRAFTEGRELELTPTEFRLLECLLRQPGRAFTRHQLMDAAIGEGAIVLERTIDVHIKTLRRKLGTADLIETVRGVGYRFRESPP